MLPIQMQLSKKKNPFFSSFFASLKSTLNFDHFQKKMTLIADVYSKLQTPQEVLR